MDRKEFRRLSAAAGVCFTVLWGDSISSTSADQERPQHRPSVCTGYFVGGRPLLVKVGTDGKDEVEISPAPIEKPQWLLREGVCPSGFALVSVHSPFGPPDAPSRHTPIAGQCCRLPAEDILLDEHQIVETECPNGFIATGGTGRDQSNSSTVNYMVCTKINSLRYRLGPPTAGVFWGFGAAYWREERRIFWREIPASIRYGAGRKGLASWLGVGCISQSFGGLLVKKTSKRCSGFEFRDLQYAGLPGDPQSGTPIEMFPHCEAIDDEFSPNAVCLGGAR